VRVKYNFVNAFQNGYWNETKWGASPPMLFNLALEKVVRELQTNEDGVLVNQNRTRLLGFVRR